MAGRAREEARERSRSRSPSSLSHVRGAKEYLDHWMRHGVAPYSRPYSTSQFTQRLKVHAIVGCSGRKTDPHVDGEAGESSQHLGLTTEEWSSRVGPNGGRCGRPPPPSISPLGFDVRPVSKSGPERGRRRGRPMPTSKLPSRCFRRALAVGAPPSPFPLRFGIGSANGGGRGGGGAFRGQGLPRAAGWQCGPRQYLAVTLPRASDLLAKIAARLRAGSGSRVEEREIDVPLGEELLKPARSLEGIASAFDDCVGMDEPSD